MPGSADPVVADDTVIVGDAEQLNEGVARKKDVLEVVGDVGCGSGFVNHLSSFFLRGSDGAEEGRDG